MAIRRHSCACGQGTAAGNSCRRWSPLSVDDQNWLFRAAMPAYGYVSTPFNNRQGGQARLPDRQQAYGSPSPPRCGLGIRRVLIVSVGAALAGGPAAQIPACGITDWAPTTLGVWRRSASGKDASPAPAAAIVPDPD